MKRFLAIVALLLLPIAGYYAFSAGLIVIKSFIGMFLISIFILGFYFGRISKL